MKKLFVIAITAFAFTACNNGGKTEGTDGKDSATATETPVTPTPTETPVTPAPVDTTVHTEVH